MEQNATEEDRGILTYSFAMEGEEDEEIIVEGYGGEFDYLHVMMGVEICMMTEDDVKKLHAYLTAWLEWRAMVAGVKDKLADLGK